MQMSAQLFMYALFDRATRGGVRGGCPIRYRRFEVPRRYLVWLSWLALLVTAAAEWLLLQHRPNLFLAPIDTAIEFTLLGLMYRRALWLLAVVRYLPLGIGLFLLSTALTYVLRLDTAQFSPVQHFIESIIMLGLSISYFRWLLQPPIIIAPLEQEPMFWISAGVVLYFAGNSLIFLTSNFTLAYSLELNRNVWAIHALLYTFLSGFYVVALSVTPSWPMPAPGSNVTQS